MTVYLFSLSYEIGQIINDHLRSYKYSSFLFGTKEELFSNIKNLKKMPDLLVLDYTMFNHDFFNIYTYLDSLKLELPVIFFNDPCITASTRTVHWLYQLDILVYKNSGTKYPEEKREEYRQLFSRIQEIVELEELAPYINLMQKPKPLPDKLIKQNFTIDYIRNNDKNFIEEFRDKTHLQPRLFYLLKIFERNSNIPLTLEEIINFYKEDGKQMTENSLKVLISNLRKEIRNNKECRFIISNNKGAYSFIGFRKS